MPRPALVFSAALMLIAAAGWVPSAEGDVVFTEVLSGPRIAGKAGVPLKSQVYLNARAMRREVISAQDRAPASPYLPSTGSSDRLAGLAILDVDRGMLWSFRPGRQPDAVRLGEVNPCPAPSGVTMGLDELRDLEVISSQPVLRRTGFRKKINGYACDHLFATVTCEVVSRTTGERGTLVLMNELWVAGEAPGIEQIRAFWRSLGRFYGLEEYFCPGAAALAEAMPEQARQLSELMLQVKGLPVSSTMTAKFKRQGARRAELYYSLTTDVLDLATVPSRPERFTPHVAARD